MTDRFRLTLAQLNPTLGDVEGNAKRAVAGARELLDGGAKHVAHDALTATAGASAYGPACDSFLQSHRRNNGDSQRLFQACLTFH